MTLHTIAHRQAKPTGVVDMDEYGTFNGKVYDTRHGGPYDRGAADSYYGRPKNPHYYIGGSYEGEAITDLTEEEVDAYTQGFHWNELFGDRKDWGR